MLIELYLPGACASFCSISFIRSSLRCLVGFLNPINLPISLNSKIVLASRLLKSNSNSSPSC